MEEGAKRKFQGVGCRTSVRKISWFISENRQPFGIRRKRGRFQQKRARNVRQTRFQSSTRRRRSFEYAVVLTYQKLIYR